MLKLTKIQLSNQKLLSDAKNPIFKKKLGFSTYMWICECGHPISGHRLCEGKCDYEQPKPCECLEYVSISFDIIVEITEADIFEREVSEHSERDSLNWWTEFNLWRKRKK